LCQDNKLKALMSMSLSALVLHKSALSMVVVIHKL